MAEADHDQTRGGEDVEALPTGAGGQPEIVRQIGSIDQVIR